MSDKARQTSSNNLLQISDNDELTSPKSQNDEVNQIQGDEKEQDEETPSSSVVGEHIYDEKQNTARPSLRLNASSFAAPTKASEAKKNEKIELAQFIKQPSLSKEPPGFPGFAMQLQSSPVPRNRRSSLKRRSTTRSTSPKAYSVTADQPSQVEEHRGTRSRSIGSIVFEGLAEEEGSGEGEKKPPILKDESLEEKLSDEQIQVEEEKQREEEKPYRQERKVLEEVEGCSTTEELLKHYIEDSDAELEESQEQTSFLTKDSTALTLSEDHIDDVEAQTATPRDQVESMSPDSTEEDKTGSVRFPTDIKNIASGQIVAENEELQAKLEEGGNQRDEAIRQCETLQQDLQNVKDDAEKLKRENDKLFTQLRESKDLIAARNAREPNLPALEVVEAENSRLRLAVEKKEKERSDANACCENLDDQLRDTQEKLKSQVTSIKELCEIVDLMSQTVSQGADIPIPHPDELSWSLAQASEIERLQIKITQLIGTFSEDLKKWQKKNGELERQMARQESEIITLEKAREYQRMEILIPGLQGPLLSPAIQTDTNRFKEVYERERQKRVEVEQEFVTAKQRLSHLHTENEKLQSDFAKAQEELANLHPKAEKLEQDARGWKEDSEEWKSQLEERTRAFETSTDQQKQETFRYIKDYYKKTKDEAHWELQGLQRKLAASEEERVALERDFKREKVDNVRLAKDVTRLEKKKTTRDSHIGNIQQAFMRGKDFPAFESDDDTSSPTSPFTTSSPTHPLDRISRTPLIPRCHLPNAIDVRKAEISAYHQELQNAREQEFFNVSVKPRMSNKTKNGFGHNEIMEKVREWKMGSSYPPRKPGWAELRRRSAWQRWDGENWAKEFARGKDVDILKKMGLWNEAWV